MSILPENITVVLITGLITLCLYFITKILDKFDRLTTDVQSLTQQVSVMKATFELELKNVKRQLKLEEEERDNG